MPDTYSPESRLRLFDAVGSCSSVAMVADRLLDPLASVLRATSSVFVEFSERPGVGVAVGTCSYLGEKSWAPDAYSEQFFAADPLFQRQLGFFADDQAGQHLRIEPEARISVLPGTGDLYLGDYYRRFLRPAGIAHVIGVGIPFHSGFGRAMLCLGFHRSSGDAAFGSAEATLLRQLAPVLTSVLTGLAAREALTVAKTVVDRMACAHPGDGYLVLDENLNVMQVGGSAAAIFGFGTSAGGRLSDVLRHQLRHDPPRLGSVARRFSLTRKGDLRPIAIEAQALPDHRGPRILVTMRTSCTAAGHDMAERHGLSAREREVARLVCAGGSNIEIADLLGISIRTVENHLRSIFEKVGVHSRTRLAARLLA